MFVKTYFRALKNDKEKGDTWDDVKDKCHLSDKGWVEHNFRDIVGSQKMVP